MEIPNSQQYIKITAVTVVNRNITFIFHIEAKKHYD